MSDWWFMKERKMGKSVLIVLSLKCLWDTSVDVSVEMQKAEHKEKSLKGLADSGRLEPCPGGVWSWRGVLRLQARQDRRAAPAFLECQVPLGSPARAAPWDPWDHLLICPTSSKAGGALWSVFYQRSPYCCWGNCVLVPCFFLMLNQTRLSRRVHQVHQEEMVLRWVLCMVLKSLQFLNFNKTQAHFGYIFPHQNWEENLKRNFLKMRNNHSNRNNDQSHS